MEMILNREEDRLSVLLRGRLDGLSSPELETVLQGKMPEIKYLDLDLSGVDYVSSAGLRVILAAQKALSRKQGHMMVRHVRPAVMEVLDMTGFSAILNIR